MAFLVNTLALPPAVWGFPPADDETSVPPGLITVDRQGRGVYPPVGELRLGSPGLTEDPKLMDRFYVHAYRFAMDSDLMAVQLPEIWYYEHIEAYRRLMRHNEPRIDSIVRSALGRAAIEELLHRDVDDQAMHEWLRAPSGTQEDFRRKLRPGFDVQIAARLSGDLSTTVWYRTGTLILGADYSTQQGRVSNLRLSYPFFSKGYRGELGVTSEGTLWLNFLGRW